MGADSGSIVPEPQADGGWQPHLLSGYLIMSTRGEEEDEERERERGRGRERERERGRERKRRRKK